MARGGARLRRLRVGIPLATQGPWDVRIMGPQLRCDATSPFTNRSIPGLVNVYITNWKITIFNRWIMVINPYPTEKYESQIGSSSQLLGKIKFMFQTTDQKRPLFCIDTMNIITTPYQYIPPKKGQFLAMSGVASAPPPNAAWVQSRASPVARTATHPGMPGAVEIATLEHFLQLNFQIPTKQEKHGQEQGVYRNTVFSARSLPWRSWKGWSNSILTLTRSNSPSTRA